MRTNGRRSRIITNESEAQTPARRHQTFNQLQQGLTSMVVNQMLLSRQALINMSILDPSGRDIDAECGYPKGELTPELYWTLYEKVGIANRVVSVYPSECWSVYPHVYETDESEETEFEKEVCNLAQDQNIWSFLERIDEMSGISRFGGLFMGMADGNDTHIPVPGWGDDAYLGLGGMTWIPQPGVGVKTWAPTPGVGSDGFPERSIFTGRNIKVQNRLLFMRAFDESNIRVNRFETNFANPRYGQPTEYLINITNPLIPTSDQGPATANLKNQIRVHWSRVLHVCDNRKASEVFGIPRMRPVIPEIMDIRKIRGGSSEMFWRGAFPGYSFETHPNLGIEVEFDHDSVKQAFEDYANGLQRFIALEGVTAKSLAPQISDPEKHLEQQYRSIAAVLGVPLRILMGSEAGHLASTQDLATWYRRVQKRQKFYIEPYIIRPFINRMCLMGALPMPKNGFNKYEIDWPDLNAMNPKDKADVALKQTQALMTYVSGGVEQIMPVLEYYIHILGLTVGEAVTILKKAKRQGRKTLSNNPTFNPQNKPQGGGRTGGDHQGDQGSPGTDAAGRVEK